MSIITKQEDTPFFDTGFDAHPRYLIVSKTYRSQSQTLFLNRKWISNISCSSSSIPPKDNGDGYKNALFLQIRFIAVDATRTWL